jgi:TrpR family transcriptional regulator, trp operon repressor
MKKITINQLIETILSLKTKDQMENLLLGILTPQELEQLPVRLEVVKRLKKGDPQRKIADDLGVGIATVTRGATEIKKGRFKDVK